ncbi:fumarylacetoacetase [Cytobacillus horneckiae]|uniref:fumarylacetoacetase n=1 Tax=Cytobacillus horneckiae TaxID=549687 RepID=A0A2N0ZBZ9_9BACI|nr:fumarylacetoacetase [Cytobacillus horneckiae]MBN6886038.1 fumarylacetoacetase [Cytobacillus horneckiae]MCM3176344.1 fumarylacetoacetase [Cytobacillus horneckiae]MEC1159179.1 fumarylacetoacetase [Cytobacillus horneckiae]MED2940760.1 fumarylacetoacetase [Cytobacillus horneckiae]PKG27019.1 fumarylacetoacetase [Cytobacillus horneckiae]
MKSFIEVHETSHFPIQNLPYGIFSTEENQNLRVGTAIGEYVLDLSILENKGFFKGVIATETTVFNKTSLNDLMKLGDKAWSGIRKKLQSLLSESEPELRDDEQLRKLVFIPSSKVQLHLPVEIGDYTDFYASKEHATNVGVMFRGKENALMPNWTHLPVGYHGRASSVVLSGEAVRRPLGQIKPPDSAPIFEQCRQLDFELEMGCFIGTGNDRGNPISVDEAEQHVFGMVLVNDWSARDIQAWEYQPLGPFLAKSFATSISPWVVTMEALEPFRTKGPDQKPKPLQYLEQNGKGSFDINLEVYLRSNKMSEAKKICSSNYRHLYWSIAQQVAHHTIAGCNLNSGDLLASGTISGADKQSRGSLLELAWRGTDPIQLNEEESREWLQDGDELTMIGWCQGENYRVGFGEVKAVIEPALDKDKVLKKNHLSYF